METTQKIYTRIWKNTGMEGTPIYVFKTAEPDGNPGSAIGDIIMLSEDTSRKYIIHSYGVEIAGTDKVAYFEDTQKYEEKYNSDAFDMGIEFVRKCEEVYYNGYTDVYFDEIANAMHDIGFKCEKGYDSYTFQHYVRVYREDFAQKMHIGLEC